MTNGLKHSRFGALTATASMLVGVSAVAAGIYTMTHPMAFTTRAQRTDDPAEVLAADSTQGLGWTAPIAEAMTVDIRPAVHRAQPLTAQLSHAAFVSAGSVMHEESCTPQWHSMAQGPAGRHVADMCAGAPLLPLPAEEPRTPGLNVLPTLRVFGSSLRDETLDSDVQPRQEPSALSSLRALDHTLASRLEGAATRHSERPLPDSTTVVRDPAPLDWTPGTTDVKPVVSTNSSRRALPRFPVKGQA